MPYRKSAKKSPLRRRAARLTVPKPVKARAVEKAKVDNVKKIVKSVIRRQLETKFTMKNFIADKVDVYGVGLNYNGTTNLNGWSSGPADSFGIVPAIQQGVGEGNRVGVKCTPKYCYLRYSLNALFTTDSTSGVNFNPFLGVPFRVRVIVYRHRNDLTDWTQAGMIDVGTQTASMGADLDTYFRPYNKDEYMIAYSRMHKMYPLRHVTGTGSTTQNMPPGCSNFVTAKVKIPVPAVLRFNDDPALLTNQASNASWFLAVAVVNDDGSTITTSQKRVQISAETGLFFTDA